VHSGIEMHAFRIHQHMQKNSVSLKEVLTSGRASVCRVFVADTPRHSRADAESARKRCIDECQYRFKYYN
jgi:hypothetical protein